MRKVKKNIISLLLLTMVVVAAGVPAATVAYPEPVHAQTLQQYFTGSESEYQKARSRLGQADSGDSTTRVLSTVSSILKFIFGFIGIILVLLVMYAGFIWMTAAGEAEKVKKAKSYLLNAAIGLVILLSASGVSIFVFNQLYARINGTSGAP